MFIINKASQRRPFGHGNFKVEITFPGVNREMDSDRGLINLGRIDHAILKPGAFIAMHKHQNDEILSLIKTGTMLHKDSMGETIQLNKNHLMMMNSGSGIFHEESVPFGSSGENVEMLQIFIRPEIENTFPKVQFSPISDWEIGKWRLIGGPEISNPPLVIYSDILVYDLSTGSSAKPIQMPNSSFKKLLYFVYIFKGVLEYKGIFLEGDSFISENEEEALLMVHPNTILVVFVINREAKYTRTGRFSGLNPF